MEAQEKTDKRKLWFQDKALELPDLGIVISGISGRLPKSNSVNELEQNLRQGRDMVSDMDNSRWPCGLWGLPTRYGRIIDLNKFDYEFFGFQTRDEGNSVGLQLRLLYEVVYESLLDAGINPSELRGSRKTSLFVASFGDNQSIGLDVDVAKINNNWRLSTELGRYFDLRGENSCIDTACSGSFSAIDAAIHSIQTGSAERAIVCAANLCVDPKVCFTMKKAGTLSPDGFVKFMDKNANGYVRSEAVVSIVLERKELSRRCYSSIMSSAVTTDGFKIEGFAHPTRRSQAELHRQVQSQCRATTNNFQYIECHGTGTAAGDPEEIAAIIEAFFPTESQVDGDTHKMRVVGPLTLGSCKTNLGHTEAAAGLCSLLKCILMLEYELIYKSLHFTDLHPNFKDSCTGKIEHSSQLARLESKMVQICSYGMGGSNSALILRANELDQIEEKPQSKCRMKTYRLVAMFGRGREQLNYFFDSMLDSNDGDYATKNCLTDDFLSLIDTMNSQKIDRLMNYRGFIIVDESKNQLIRRINECVQKPGLDADHFQSYSERQVNVIFTGLGSDWPEMAAGLREHEPFWSTIKRLDSYLKSANLQVDLVDVITTSRELTTQMEKTVALVAISIAQFNIISDQLRLKNKINKFIGHSYGEISCAYARELITEEQAIITAFKMGRIVDDSLDLKAGKSIAIMMGEQEIGKIIDELALTSVLVCCVNGPKAVVVSGRHDDMDKLIDYFGEKSIWFKSISDEIAAHNPKIYDENSRSEMKLRYKHGLQDPQLDMIACHSEDWLPLAQELSSGEFKSMKLLDYLSECNMRIIDLTKAVDQLSSGSINIEFGPCSHFEGQLNNEKFYGHTSIMKKSTPKEAQVTSLLESIGSLHNLGCQLDLSNFNKFNSSNTNRLPRRLTPSISSLIKWKHDDVLFVPTWSDDSDSKMTIDLARFIKSNSYLSDHVVGEKLVFPAAGYIYLLWPMLSMSESNSPNCDYVHLLTNTTSSVLKTFGPVEFNEVKFHRPAVIDQSKPNSQCILELEYLRQLNKFSIRQSDVLICDGFMKRPRDEVIKLDQAAYETQYGDDNDEVWHAEDIYRQFRTIGLNFGPEFRLIESSGNHGKLNFVKRGRNFICLLDAIFQCHFMANSTVDCSFELCMPTGIEQIQVQPGLFERFDEALESNTQTQDQAIDMQLEASCNTNILKKDELIRVVANPYLQEVYTNGIRLKGMRAATLTNQQSLYRQQLNLLSQDFVKDFECDHQSSINKFATDYVSICDAVALNYLLDHELCIENLDPNLLPEKYAQPDDIASYRKQNIKVHSQESEEQLDVKSYGHNMLLYHLDRLLTSGESINEILSLLKNASNKFNLVQNDIIQNYWTQDKLIVPIAESLIENLCIESKRISFLEVNNDNLCVLNKICSVITKLNQQIRVVRSLVNPNLHELESNRMIDHRELYDFTSQNLDSRSIENISKLYKNFDCLIYRDSTCNVIALSSSIEKTSNDSEFIDIFNSLIQLIKPSGYLVVMSRNKLSFGEILISTLMQMTYNGQNANIHLEIAKRLAENLMKTQDLYPKRHDLIESQAELSKLVCVSKKFDEITGQTVLLYKKPAEEEGSIRPKILIRVDNIISVTDVRSPGDQNWLDTLKQSLQSLESEPNKQIWLCAISTKQNKHNGLIGMTKTLIKEVGGSNLRCYFDMHTFKDTDEPIKVDQIESCDNFKVALRRNQLWNCIDEDGNFGSFRHLDVAEYFRNDSCKPSKQSMVDYVKIDDRNIKHSYLHQTITGNLSSFHWFESKLNTRICDDDDDIIVINYSALNFRDIMISTGVLKMRPRLGAITENNILGLEYSGSRKKTGKRVMGLSTGGAIATAIHTGPQDQIFELECPEWMSLQEAATIPAVYVTNYIGLIERAKMRPGESILIHSATGGIGQSAMHLCHHYGLTIYTTVGSEEKREFLLKEFGHCIDDSRIFSSRNCNFEHQIMTMTKGRGVDLVLNSLAGDILRASLRCLAQNGRFIEIGKRDSMENMKLDYSDLDINKTIIPVHAENFSLEKMRYFASQVVRGMVEGYVKPLKYHKFKHNEVEQAFRLMAKGGHIGKVLIEINPEQNASLGLIPSIRCEPRPEIFAQKSYIITGGLGGFGFELCKWLVGNLEVRNLIITSRKGISTPYQRTTIKKLTEMYNCNIKVVDSSIADATTKGGCLKLCKMAMNMTPSNQVGGIFHLAMVMCEKSIVDTTQQDFVDVCSPKLATGIYLDEVTQELGMNLDYFVCFSSLASAYGQHHLSAYSYANSGLEILCASRRSRGQHGLAIQWGPIADVGLLYDKHGNSSGQFGNIVGQKLLSCFETISKLLVSPFAVCVSYITKNIDSNSSKSRNLRNMILDTLGIHETSKIDSNTRMSSFGIDSIMMVEFSRLIQDYTSKNWSYNDIMNLKLCDLDLIDATELMEKGLDIDQKIGLASNTTAIIKNSESNVMNKNADHSTIMLSSEDEKFVLDKLKQISNSSRVVILFRQIQIENDLYVILNDCKTPQALGNKPLFFAPPGYGMFDELIKVCKQITDRPCVGLNYTQNLCMKPTIEAMACELLEIIKIYLKEQQQFKTQGFEEPEEFQVDIVGHSIGGVMAFEIMCLLKSDPVCVNHLKLIPGKLIIIDMGLRVDSREYFDLIDTNESDYTKKMVIGFVSYHMLANEVEDPKIAETLRKLMNSDALEEMIEIGAESLSIELAKSMTPFYETQLSASIRGIPIEHRQATIKDSVSVTMRCLLSKVGALLRYCNVNAIYLDCLLIKSGDEFLSTMASEQLPEDLGLSDAILGEITIRTLPGYHATFLSDYPDQIFQEIINYLS